MTRRAPAVWGESGADPEGRVDGQAVRGHVLEALRLPLPRVWVRCDLADTAWPGASSSPTWSSSTENLSLARCDDVRAPELGIAAGERGLSAAHGMPMRRAVLPGLTMVAVAGVAVDLSEALADDATIRSSWLPRLQASMFRGENTHFCSGTRWIRATRRERLVAFRSVLMGANFRHGVFC